MAGNTIHLPIFDPNVTKYTNNDHTLFYAPSGRVYLPPNIFYCFGINGILTKLTNKKKDAISHQGDLWATKYWNLYAFIDPTQRDDDARPVQILDPTATNKLKFIKRVLELFGTQKGSIFLGQIKKDLDREVVKRCIADKGKLRGENPTCEGDVMEVIKNLVGQPDKRVFNFVFNWVTSVTMESGCEWLELSIKQYLKDQHLLVELPPASSYPKSANRHSLVKLSIKKGTDNIKSVVKRVQSDYFGKVIKSKIKVNNDAKVGSAEHNNYLAHMADPLFDLVFFDDSKYVPTSRYKNPCYFLEITRTIGDSEMTNHRLAQAVNASNGTVTLPVMINRHMSIYQSVHNPGFGLAVPNATMGTGDSVVSQQPGAEAVELVS